MIASWSVWRCDTYLDAASFAPAFHPKDPIILFSSNYGDPRGREFEIVPGPDTPAAGLEAIRRRAAELIASAMPEPEAGLTTAMLIGLRDLVARDIADRQPPDRA